MLSLWNPRITAIWRVGFMREIFGTSVQCCTCLLHKLVQKLQKVHPPLSKNRATLTFNLACSNIYFPRVRILQTKLLVYTVLSSPELLLYSFFRTILQSLTDSNSRALVRNAALQKVRLKPVYFWICWEAHVWHKMRLLSLYIHAMYIQNSNYIYSTWNFRHEVALTCPSSLSPCDLV